MKSQLMEERIRRITVLFSELSFRVIEDERSHNAYSATFEDDDAFQAGVLIERGSRFLELAYALTFPTSFSQLMKGKLEEMLKICYEFGCYVSLQQTATEISYSVFTKIYYSGSELLLAARQPAGLPRVRRGAHGPAGNRQGSPGNTRSDRAYRVGARLARCS